MLARIDATASARRARFLEHWFGAEAQGRHPRRCGMGSWPGRSLRADTGSATPTGARLPQRSAAHARRRRRPHAPGAKHKSNLDAYLISDFEGYLARDQATLCEPITARAARGRRHLLRALPRLEPQPPPTPIAPPGRASRSPASPLTCPGLLRWSRAPRPSPIFELRERLAQALTTAGHGVAQAARDPRFIDTASSCTLAVLQRDRLDLVHAGETGGYLLRNRRLARISQGASPDGYGGPNGSRPPPLGVPAPALPPLYSYDLRLGDTLLLCSRGVAATLDEGRLQGILLSSANLDVAAKSILDAALALRSEHNPTVVLAAPME